MPVGTRGMSARDFARDSCRSVIRLTLQARQASSYVYQEFDMHEEPSIILLSPSQTKGDFKQLWSSKVHPTVG